MSKKRKKRRDAIPPETRPIEAPAVTWQTNGKMHRILLAVFAFLLYANTLGHQYCQDDAIVITQNMYTTQGIKGIPGILQKDTFYGFFKEEGKAALVQGGRYRPLTLVMFALIWQIFGDNPFLFHLFNVLLYAGVVLLLYQVVFELLHTRPPKQRRLTALIAALIFAAHPVHTEVVANIKGADEIVALGGSLLTLLWTVQAYRKEDFRKLLMAAVVFGLTIFSKENTITFLAIIPVALLLFGQKSAGLAMDKAGKVGRFVWPLLVAVLPFLVIRSSIIKSGGGPVMELMNNPFLKVVNGRFVPYSFGEKMATIFYTLGDYLRLLFFPHPLTSDYYPAHVTMHHFGDWQVLLSVLLYAGLIVIGIKNLKRNPLLSFGIFVYFASLSIVSNILFPVGTFMAERFLFMPSAGFAMAVAALLVRIFNKKPSTLIAVAGIIALLFGLKTVQRNPAWKNDDTLFLTDVKVSKNSAKINNAVGGTLLAQAAKIKDRTLQKQKAAEAIKHLNVALKVHPNYKNAWLLLGNAYLYLDDYDKAVNAYKNALRVAPGYREATENLFIAYRSGGRYFGEKKNDLAKALKFLKEAEKMRPDDPEVLRLLGVANAVGGNLTEAVRYMERAFEKQPENADLALDISTAYHQLGNTEKSAFYKQKALAIDPEVINKRMKKK